MKKLILLLLTIISGLSARSADTITFIEYDGIIYYTSSEPADGLPGTAVVEENRSANGDVVIPDTIYVYGKPYIVNGISGQAFRGSSISSIRLPNTLKSIGYEAFNYCNRLTSVVIPDSVIQIYAGAFAKCSRLASVKNREIS